MGHPKLTWNDPMGGEKTYEVSSDQVLIGRKSDSDIVLPNPYISRHHAKIIREGEACFIADLNSTHPVRPAQQRRDRVAVGGQRQTQLRRAACRRLMPSAQASRTFRYMSTVMILTPSLPSAGRT